MTSRTQNRWWEEYFDDSFVSLYRPLLPAEQTWQEVAGLVEALDLSPGARVLDLACGWGRHAVELARFGYDVCGLDRSEPLLRHAQRIAAEAGVRVHWTRGDVRELPWTNRFDAVVCLFSSLGYFLSDAEDLRALVAVREALRPGAALLIETMHRDLIARQFVGRDWWEGERGEHVWVEREFDAAAGISREWLRWRDAAGVTGEKFHAIRVRSGPEWDALLRAAGLEPAEWYGGWELARFTHESERLIILARRGP